MSLLIRHPYPNWRLDLPNLTQLSFGGLIIHENWLKLCFLDLVGSRTGSIGGFGGDNSQHVWIMLESQLMKIYENLYPFGLRNAMHSWWNRPSSHTVMAWIWQGSMAGRDHVYMHTPWVPGPAFGLAKLGFQAGSWVRICRNYLKNWKPGAWKLIRHIFRGLLKWGYPQIISFNRIFHYKPSILGT